MKIFKPFVLLALLSSLLLSGCDEGGFSIAPSTVDDTAEQNNLSDDENNPNKDGVYGGGGGSNSEDHQDENNPSTDISHPGTTPEVTPQVDLGTQIVIFKLTFISIDNNFVFVSCSEDPLNEKYNFAYYTIDNQELENSRTVPKEVVNDKETYKFYLGSEESKTYTIQFYDTNGKQYGKADLTIEIQKENHTFFSNVKNIVEVKFITIGMNFLNQFNKVKEFFRRLFGGRGY